MEEDISNKVIHSAYLERSYVKEQIEVLKKVADEAKAKIDERLVKNEEVQKSIRTVEAFLRKSGRICYGGQAINANLPQDLKFYKKNRELPDYDFFTPNVDKDVQDIIRMLKKEGFTEIHEKKGVHEGTRKIIVNFNAIADITYLEPNLYHHFYENTVLFAGIRYAGPDLLRMMMYLELSRPAGQVERWPKVYERLLLLNHAHPMRLCNDHKIPKKTINPFYRQKIIDYIIQEKYILAGAEVGFVYRKHEEADAEMDWILRSGGTILFFSSDFDKDTEAIKDILGRKGVHVEDRKGTINVIPDRRLIRKGKQLVVYMIGQEACNSYNSLDLKEAGHIRIASIDTLITLYLQMGLLTEDEKILGIPILCLAQRFIQLANKLRTGTKFPSFSIKCSGHQTTFQSLLRERDKKHKKKTIKKQKPRKTFKKRPLLKRSTRKQTQKNEAPVVPEGEQND
jgi:hypothetical protein